MSGGRWEREAVAEKGWGAAKAALYAMEHATLMRATCQLGITGCSLLIVSVAGPAIHRLLAVRLGLTGWGRAPST